jgi:hypothetical protein
MGPLLSFHSNPLATSQSTFSSLAGRTRRRRPKFDSPKTRYAPNMNGEDRPLFFLYWHKSTLSAISTRHRQQTAGGG